jgi:hypothetical protein
MDLRPASTTLNDPAAESSHRGDQGFNPQHALAIEPVLVQRPDRRAGVLKRVALAVREEAVRAVLMLHEVCPLSSGIADAVLRQEVRIGVIGPSRACMANISTAEAIRQPTLR